MILPIVAYGDPVLKKPCKEVPKDYLDLKALIVNMFESMYNAAGVGLAAPQVGLTIRLFIMDSTVIKNEEEEDEDEDQRVLVKRTIINPVILERTGEDEPYNEGCLSIPHIKEDIIRKEKIVIEYYDENFKKHKEVFNDINARIIQHEYDHIEGKLFTDYLSSLTKQLLKKDLLAISKGEVKVDYPMLFPIKKRSRA